jgi:enoyl-CoA hydratase/carnithine racemase
MHAAPAPLRVDKPGDRVERVTLDRPHAANALDTEMARELIGYFEALALEPQRVGCVVLTGQGDKAFCAGGDLKQRRGMSETAWVAQHLVFERMARAILACPTPVIAAVNGAAYGGGCEIAALCDFIFAADSAKFALPETGLGIIPGAGGTQTLARAIGERRAKELILSGRVFTAAEAQAWGLVNETYPLADLAPQTLRVAQAIAARAPLAVRQAKQAIARGLQMSIHDGMAFEIEAYHRLIPTEDRSEGVDAYNEGRRPVFKGR